MKCFNCLTIFVYSLNTCHYTILLFSITDAINNGDAKGFNIKAIILACLQQDICYVKKIKQCFFLCFCAYFVNIPNTYFYSDIR